VNGANVEKDWNWINHLLKNQFFEKMKKEIPKETWEPALLFEELDVKLDNQSDKMSLLAV